MPCTCAYSSASSATGGAPFIDPFQLFAAMSVVTERIEFLTGVLKLPIRNPVLVAKQVSSLSVFTGEVAHMLLIALIVVFFNVAAEHVHPFDGSLCIKKCPDTSDLKLLDSHSPFC